MTETPGAGSLPRGIGTRLGWLTFSLLTLGLGISGGLILHDQLNTPVAGRATLPLSERLAQVPPSGPAGDPVIISGVGSSRAVRCEGNTVSVNGVRNEVTLTGRCTRVDVTGVENTVIVESAEAIDVSGVDNTVTFLSGEPELSRSGIGNTVAPG
jgi:hypothetical protein